MVHNIFILNIVQEKEFGHTSHLYSIIKIIADNFQIQNNNSKKVQQKDKLLLDLEQRGRKETARQTDQQY